MLGDALLDGMVVGVRVGCMLMVGILLGRSEGNMLGCELGVVEGF